MRACSVAKEFGFGDMKNHVRKDQVFGMFCWDMLRGLMTAHVWFQKKITGGVFFSRGFQYRRFAISTFCTLHALGEDKFEGVVQSFWKLVFCTFSTRT
jgi:hypothetical protein